MVVQHRVRQTQTTLGAVKEVAPPTNTAKTTLITVELTLVCVVVETTGLTEIVTKLEPTL